MSPHNTEGEHHNESRPQQILREAADEESISDEEAVLAYNANADRQDEAENHGTAREDQRPAAPGSRLRKGKNSS